MPTDPVSLDAGNQKICLPIVSIQFNLITVWGVDLNLSAGITE
ncbi:MAG: hypothetical protein V4708_13915 [Bacteroidota bacterium]